MEKQEKALEQNSHKNDLHNWTFQYIAAFSASLATLSTGTILGWPSQITSKLLENNLDIPLNLDEIGWIYSCSSLGAAFLSFFIGPICDKLGRKLTMLLMIIPLELGWLLIIFGENVWMLVFGRFVTGMIGGSFCVTVSLYINEIAQKEVRGLLGGLTQFMISCGVLIANVVGKFFSVRDFSIFCALLPILFALIFFSMPESPLYLQTKGRTDDCKDSLRKLLGKQIVEVEFNEIQDYLHIETHTDLILDILRKKSLKKALIIGVGLTFVKVLSGIDAITSYLSHIFDNTDTAIGSQNAAILFAIAQVLSIVPQALMVDKWGRKILLITTQIAMAFFLLSTALCLHLKSEDTDKVLDYIPVVGLCMYTISFSIGIGPIGWILTAEIFEEWVRAPAMSLCCFLIWILAFGNIKVFGVVEDALDISVPIFVYSGVCFVAAFFVLIFVPETSNKSFSEIEMKLSR